VLVDQLNVAITPKQQGKIIKRTHHTLKLHAIDQKNRYGNLILTDMVKKYVLHVLCLFAGHQLDPFFLFWAEIAVLPVLSSVLLWRLTTKASRKTCLSKASHPDRSTNHEHADRNNLELICWHKTINH
jgi:hypothetical protein